MKQKIINGYRFTYSEAVTFIENSTNNELFALADSLREHFFNRRFSTCVIMNAKSGKCSEDCKWCAQSAHYKTTSSVYEMVETNEAIAEAQKAKNAGIRMFSLVTSGRKLTPANLSKISHTFSTLNKKIPGIGYCASLGLLSKSDLETLYNAGVRRYHCNIETAPSIFSKLCTTHTVEDKVKTINAAKELGIQICSGGIIGMGETEKERIEMAVFLQQLGVESIPVNILMPIAGTPLENAAPLTDSEILRAFAIFRIINPTAEIRFAAGRLRIRHILSEALACGVTASLVGDMLTTVGSGIEEDMNFLKENNYEI
jgi:biotin synthase